MNREIIKPKVIGNIIIDKKRAKKSNQHIKSIIKDNKKKHK